MPNRTHEVCIATAPKWCPKESHSFDHMLYKGIFCFDCRFLQGKDQSLGIVVSGFVAKHSAKTAPLPVR